MRVQALLCLLLTLFVPGLAFGKPPVPTAAGQS